jgi:hypothetical protein
MTKINDYKALLSRVENTTKQKGLDLSSGEDLSIGIMNLISIEEHLFFTYNKTKDSKFIDLLDEVRRMRTELMKEIIKEYQGEVWCISKHLLAASMRIMEVGTKELKKGDKKKASSLFEKSYQLYSLFWGLNLNIVDISNAGKVSGMSSNVNYLNEKNSALGKESVFSKLGALVQKAIDCCKE